MCLLLGTYSVYAAGEVLRAPVTEAAVGDHHPQLAWLARCPRLHARLQPAAGAALDHQACVACVVQHVGAFLVHNYQVRDNCRSDDCVRCGPPTRVHVQKEVVQAKQAAPAAGFVEVVLVVLAVAGVLLWRLPPAAEFLSHTLTCLVEALLGGCGDCCGQDKVAAHVWQVQEGPVVNAEAIVGSLPVVCRGGGVGGG